MTISASVRVGMGRYSDREEFGLSAMLIIK
jgi:hypothetical protein